MVGCPKADVADERSGLADLPEYVQLLANSGYMEVRFENTPTKFLGHTVPQSTVGRMRAPRKLN
jgi:hypothetical protein